MKAAETFGWTAAGNAVLTSGDTAGDSASLTAGQFSHHYP